MTNKNETLLRYTIKHYDNLDDYEKSYIDKLLSKDKKLKEKFNGIVIEKITLEPLTVKASQWLMDSMPKEEMEE